MSIEVTHPDTLTPTNKLNDILYAHPHTVNSNIDSSDMSTAMQTLLTNIETLLTALSGKTIEIPVLIESKTITAGTTTVTFSGLNGDSDEEYLLKGNIVMTSDLNSIVIYPNNDNSSNYLGNNHSIYTTTSHSVTSLTSIRIAQPNNNQETTAKIECKLYSTSGEPRQYHALTDHYLSGRSLQTINSGYWTNTSDNITSLVITRYTSSGSFSGTLSLFKIVKISL